MKTYTLVPPRPRSAREWAFRPLSKLQRSTIGRLASAAYAAVVASGAETPAGRTKTAAAQAWRHAQYLAATGRQSLDECDQAAFRPLCAHFNAMIGTPSSAARSFRDSMRTGPVSGTADDGDTHEARDLWQHLLDEACELLGLHIEYAAAICRTKYKCALSAATADQRKKLTFDIRRNGQRRKAQQIP